MTIERSSRPDRLRSGPSAAAPAAVCLLAAACAVFALAPARHARGGEREAPVVAGWIETVCLTDFAVCLDAKLDTGADTSSLHVPRLETFQKDGGTWVRFALTGPAGRDAAIERPVERLARVRRAGAAVSERVVIRLGICLAGAAGDAEFTLTDRGGMDYRMLIGRRFLSGRIVVDPGKRFTGTGKCDAGTPPR